MRIQKIKVTQAFIADRARLLAEEHGIEFRASNSRLDNFMLRHDFALRRTTIQEEEIQSHQKMPSYVNGGKMHGTLSLVIIFIAPFKVQASPTITKSGILQNMTQLKVYSLMMKYFKSLNKLVKRTNKSYLLIQCYLVI